MEKFNLNGVSVQKIVFLLSALAFFGTSYLITFVSCWLVHSPGMMCVYAIGLTVGFVLWKIYGNRLFSLFQQCRIWTKVISVFVSLFLMRGSNLFYENFCMSSKLNGIALAIGVPIEVIGSLLTLFLIFFSLYFLVVCVSVVLKIFIDSVIGNDEFSKITQSTKQTFILVLFALLGTFVLLEFICAVTPLKQGVRGIDSAVFQYMGYAMSEGEVIYRDVFDHKGPLLFFINYAGYLIHPQLGLWLFDFIAVFIVVVYVYKIAKIPCQTILCSLIVTIITVLNLCSCFERGNFTEEFAIPCITIALYIFLEYIIYDKISIVRLIVCGVCGSCVLLLRPNMAVTWLVFPIAVIVKELQTENWKQLWKFVVWFIVGVVIPFVPTFIYLGLNGAIDDFIECYILFNVQYTDSEGGFVSIISAISYFFTIMPIYGIVLISAIILAVKKRSILYITYAVYLILALLCAFMSGRSYSHYAMPLIPLLPFLLGKFISKNKSMIMIVLIVVLLFTNFISIRETSYSQNIADNEVIIKISQYLKDNSEKNEKLFVCCATRMAYINLFSERLCASKYVYQDPISEVSSKVREDLYNGLEKNPPSIIVTRNVTDKKYIANCLKELSEFLLSHYTYTLVYEVNDYRVWRL